MSLPFKSSSFLVLKVVHKYKLQRTQEIVPKAERSVLVKAHTHIQTEMGTLLDTTSKKNPHYIEVALVVVLTVWHIWQIMGFQGEV